MKQGLTKKTARKTFHLVVNPRKYYYKRVAEFAEGKKGKKILEIGSGPLVNNKYYYSTEHLFEKSNDFIKTDIVKAYGHRIVDVTKMKYENEFDAIICLHVLEHVYECQKAFKRIHHALKKGGTAVIVVPAFYPLHDEPHDYWRFTEHSLKILLSEFKSFKITHRGKRELPVGYYIEAIK